MEKWGGSNRDPMIRSFDAPEHGLLWPVSLLRHRRHQPTFFCFFCFCFCFFYLQTDHVGLMHVLPALDCTFAVVHASVHAAAADQWCHDETLGDIDWLAISSCVPGNKPEKQSLFYYDEVTDELNCTKGYRAEHPVNVSVFPIKALKSMSTDFKIAKKEVEL